MRSADRQTLAPSNRPTVARGGWRGIRRIQIEIAILAVVLAMGMQAFRLGKLREALIKHHDEAAYELERTAAALYGTILFSVDRPIDPESGRPRSLTPREWERARAYRRLARWYRWQAWRYRLPLFASVSRYRGSNAVEIDTREWIKKIGYLERIEWALPAEDSTPRP